MCGIGGFTSSSVIQAFGVSVVSYHLSLSLVLLRTDCILLSPYLTIACQWCGLVNQTAFREHTCANEKGRETKIVQGFSEQIGRAHV